MATEATTTAASTIATIAAQLVCAGRLKIKYYFKTPVFPRFSKEVFHIEILKNILNNKDYMSKVNCLKHFEYNEVNKWVIV